MKLGIPKNGLRLRENFSRLAWKALLALDGDSGHDFQTNGELALVTALVRRWKAEGVERAMVFDVGANQGHWSVSVMEVAGREGQGVDLHLFEPTQAGQAAIRQQARLSGCRLNAFGLSDVAESREIFFDTPLSGFASLHQRSVDVNLERTERVRLDRFDRYVEEAGIKHVHLLKMDIEGHELQALRGAGEKLSPEFVDCVQFEYGRCNLDSGTSLRDIFGLLESRGFRMAKVLAHGLSGRTYKPWLETYSHGNFVALAPALAESC